MGLDARGDISCIGDNYNYLILCSLLILEITRWRSKRLSVLLIKGGNAFFFGRDNAVKRLIGGGELSLEDDADHDMGTMRS